MYRDNIYIDGDKPAPILKIVADVLNLKEIDSYLQDENWKISITKNDYSPDAEGFLNYRLVLEIDSSLDEKSYKNQILSLFNELKKSYKYVVVTWDFEEEYPELSKDENEL